MIVNQANLHGLTVGYSTAFNKSFDTTQSNYQKVATVVPSTTGEQDYKWLGQMRDRMMTVRAVGTFLSNHVHFLSASVMMETINAITPIKRTICDTSTVKFVIQTTPFLSFFLRIMHKTIRACTKYMLLSYTHYERLFRGNIFGKSIIIIHVKNAHLSYHWLILQYVSYLLGCQIILLCKLL